MDNTINNKNTHTQHFKMDSCYINEQNKDNKSIFTYVTDTTKYINKSNCFDSSPPFLNYIPSGIQAQNIDIENDLRGAMRSNTRCTSCKYQSPDPNLASNGMNKDIKYNTNECKPDFQRFGSK